MKSIGIVIPWFGPSLKGGAEQITWQFAHRLAKRGHCVEVLTTCCRSFLDDWSINHFQPGISYEEKVKVHRFPTDYRDSARFNQLNSRLLQFPLSQLKPGICPLSDEDSRIFFKENINSSALLDYLREHSTHYDVFTFIPYLYGPIVYGLPIVAEKAWLQPCLHNEAYAYLPEIDFIFRKAKGLLFNSDGEAQLAASLFGPGIVLKSSVVGGGVEVGEIQSTNVPGNETGNSLFKSKRYVLCLGRRDSTKNTDLLTRAYVSFKKANPHSDLNLVLAGPGTLDPDWLSEGIIDLGVIDEHHKMALLTNCLALFQPSRNESLSRVMMEAWLFGRPVAVHRDCLATSAAVELSGGGWLAGEGTEWVSLLSLVDEIHSERLDELGTKGQSYAKEMADWEKALDRYEKVLDLDNGKKRGGNGTHPLQLSPLPRRRVKEIHQLTPSVAYGDAISNEAIFIRDFLRELGYESKILVRYLDERMEKEALVFKPGLLAADAGLIYHHSIGSELTPYAIAHNGPKCLIYHNITPASYYLPFDPSIAELLRIGREELKTMSAHFPYSLGDSEFNCQELAGMGFKATEVLPITVDPRRWNVPPDQTLMARLQDGCSNLLFVGRIAPNKCQHDLIRAFAAYLKYDPNGRLIIAGTAPGNSTYSQYLHSLTGKLGLTGRVLFTSLLTDAELQACYRTAQLFWSMSEHEGFCVPLIEAMWFDIPVLAYNATAVAGTLDDAGVLFTDKTRIEEIAVLARILGKDRVYRTQILSAQRRRRLTFLPDNQNQALFKMVSCLDSG